MEIKTEHPWTVEVRFAGLYLSGGLNVMHAQYADKQQATAFYETVRDNIKAKKDRSNATLIEVIDDFGVGIIATENIESVSMVNMDSVLTHNALRNGQANAIMRSTTPDPTSGAD